MNSNDATNRDNNAPQIADHNDANGLPANDQIERESIPMTELIARTKSGDANNITSEPNRQNGMSSNRNAINFLVLGYVILVIILLYCYFGTLIGDLIADNNEDLKFIRTITSTELIVILWLAIILGTCLLLFLRFKVLKMENEKFGVKKKDKRKSEDFTAFLNSNRSKSSFKKCHLCQVIVESSANKTENMPFWQQ